MDNLRKPLTFTCGKWLSASKGDHKIFTVLYPNKTSNESPRSHSDPRSRSRDDRRPRDDTMYKVQVFTGDMRNADTSAGVYLTLYGREDMSDKIPLRQPGKKCFDRGQRDVFSVSVPRMLGDIDKIRLVAVLCADYVRHIHSDGYYGT